MTSATAHKRLDGIETYLTPKDWAIRLVAEARKYPSTLAYNRAMAQLPLDELPTRRPYAAFKRQAAVRHTGRHPEDSRARHQLTDALWQEFHTLKLLIARVNEALESKLDRVNLQTALQLSALHTLIVQDAIARAAKPACALIAATKQHAGQKQRAAVLNDLAAFTEIGWTAIETAHGHYPSPLAEWQHEYSALLQDFHMHRAAIDVVQAQRFDGHPILLPTVESAWTETMQTIERATVRVNEYLGYRLESAATVPDAGAANGNLTVCLATIKAGANNPRATAIAANWMKAARLEAIESESEHWERWRKQWQTRD